MAVGLNRNIVVVEVIEVRGKCALNYKPGDRFIFEKFYVKEIDKPLCLHALNSMASTLILMLKGFSMKEVGLSNEENIAYVQCPDPGEPYTSGGTVLFKLMRIGSTKG